MQPRDFLDVARSDVNGPSEAYWRAAMSRAYYALLLEARDVLERWGFTPPARDRVHTFVRLSFVFARDQDVKAIGYVIERLVKLRNEADYQISQSGRFADDADARQAILEAAAAIDLLDQIDAD